MEENDVNGTGGQAALASGSPVGQTFEVYASKNEADAKALASSKPGAMCFATDTTHIVFNGKAYGGDALTSWQKEYLKRQEQAEKEAKLSVAVSVEPSGFVEKDVTTSFTATVTVKYDGKAADATALSGTGMLANFALTTSGGKTAFTKTGTGTYTAKVSGTSGGTFGVSATSNGVTKSASATVSAYYRTYYGVNGASSVDAAKIKAMSSRIQASAAGEYTFTFTANTYAYVCIPDGVKVPGSLSGSKPQGVEGPLPVYFTKQGTVAVDGVNYTVFRIADMQAASTHTIKFS